MFVSMKICSIVAQLVNGILKDGPHAFKRFMKGKTILFVHNQINQGSSRSHKYRKECEGSVQLDSKTHYQRAANSTSTR